MLNRECRVTKGGKTSTFEIPCSTFFAYYSRSVSRLRGEAPVSAVQDNPETWENKHLNPRILDHFLYEIWGRTKNCYKQKRKLDFKGEIITCPFMSTCAWIVIRNLNALLSEVTDPCHALNAMARTSSAGCPPAVSRAEGTIHRLQVHQDVRPAPAAIVPHVIDNGILSFSWW